MSISIPLPAFDSVVINLTERLDETSTLYQCLGFQLFEQDNYRLTPGSSEPAGGDSGMILSGGKQARDDRGILHILWQKIRPYF